jgi:ABC-type transporter Mla subunit MlaD
MAMNIYPEIRSELRDAHRVTVIVGGAAGELEKSSREWRQASQQSEQLTAQSVQILQNLSTATRNLNSTTDSLTALIENTDKSVNVQLLPQLTKTIGENDARLSQLVADTDQTVLAFGNTSKSAAEAMAQASGTMAQASKVLADPSIPAILANTQTASQNVASTTAHIDAASADVQVKVHEMTRPATFAKRMAEAVLTLAAPVVSIFK